MTGDRPAAPGSPLAGIRERLAQQREKLFTDLAVPRWPEKMGIDAVVRFKPVPHTLIDQAVKKARRSKDPEAAVIANSRVLVEACLGVYYRDRDGELTSFNPDGDAPRFDNVLGAIIGAEETEGAIGVVRKFYFTDGDIASTSTALAEFSGYTNADLLEDAQGE
jgi:hypothetical protein